MTLREALGSVAREQRTFMGMSKSELARSIGIHRNSIENIEKGLNNVSFDTVWKIAVALDMYPAELVQLVEERMNLR